VNKLSFCLEYGECFALLGVNGAGKTTTFKTLTCEHFPTSGNVFINGKEITQNFEEIRSSIGYCPQFDAIFDYMTVNENLEFYAKIKGIQKNIIPQIIDSLISELKLSRYKNDISGNLR
jgi:ATP-binding cassette, subfamily A (ABC1), member 3